MLSVARGPPTTLTPNTRLELCGQDAEAGEDRICPLGADAQRQDSQRIAGSNSFSQDERFYGSQIRLSTERREAGCEVRDETDKSRFNGRLEAGCRGTTTAC